MKKTLALLLALMMILTVSLVACSNGNNSNNNGDDFDDDDDGFVINNGTQTDDTDTDTDTDNAGGWEAVSVTVYVLASNLNIRSAADTKNSNVLGQASIGDSFVATAADDDWYKITYEGNEAYISAAYVTINQAESIFEDCAEEPLKVVNKVLDENATKPTEKYAAVNLRTSPVVDDTTSAGIVLIYSDTANGELVKIGANKAGNWYKVKYNEKTYYVGSGAFKYFEGYTGGSAGGLG